MVGILARSACSPSVFLLHLLVLAFHKSRHNRPTLFECFSPFAFLYENKMFALINKRQRCQCLHPMPSTSESPSKRPSTCTINRTFPMDVQKISLSSISSTSWFFIIIINNFSFDSNRMITIMVLNVTINKESDDDDYYDDDEIDWDMLGGATPTGSDDDVFYYYD